MEGNCFGCCGATTGSPKFKIDFLPGGLKDVATAKETAAKINAVTGVYFSTRAGVSDQILAAATTD